MRGWRVGKCGAIEMLTVNSAAKPARRTKKTQETSDTYVGVVAPLSPRHRVIECKDQIQWIIQARRGERHGQPRWEALSYCRTRDALMRLSHAVCERIDPNALAILLALPSHFGGSS